MGTITSQCSHAKVIPGKKTILEDIGHGHPHITFAPGITSAPTLQ